MGEVGKMEEMGENGGKWREMGGNGGKWGKMGNHEQVKRKDVGTISRVGDKWGEIGDKRRKMGGIERGKNGAEYLVFTVPFSPSTVPFIKITSPHSSTKKGGFLSSPTLTATAASADGCMWITMGCSGIVGATLFTHVCVYHALALLSGVVVLLGVVAPTAGRPSPHPLPALFATGVWEDAMHGDDTTICPQPQHNFLFWGWHTRLITWYSRQRLGIQAQSCYDDATND